MAVPPYFFQCTATTRGQKAHLALGPHDIFCDTGLDIHLLVHVTRNYSNGFSIQQPETY